MLLIEKEKVEQGVISMLKVNMGLSSGEKLLVVTDVPSTEEWAKNVVHVIPLVNRINYRKYQGEH